MRVADHARAFAEVGFFVFVELEASEKRSSRGLVGGEGDSGVSAYHFCKATGRDDVASVN